VPTIKITDSVSLSSDLKIGDDSLLSAAGLKSITSHSASFVGDFGKPLDQSGFKSATFGANFTAPAQLIASATKLTIRSDVSGALTTFTQRDQKLFADEFSLEIDIGPAECWVACEIDVTLGGKLSGTVDGVGVGIDAGTAACFTTYTLVKKIAGSFPLLQEGLAAAFSSYSVNFNADALLRQLPGTVNVSDLKGTVTFSGKYSLPISVNSLASADLPFNHRINVNAGVTVSVSGSLALTGEFVVRAHRVSDTELHFGVYKKKGSTFTVSFTASASMEADVGSKDLISAFLGAIFHAPDVSQLGLSGKKAGTLNDALKDCLDHSLAISLNAACSASGTDEAAVVYSIDLRGGDAEKTKAAIAAALRGDWTQLADLPNAGLRRNILKETNQTEHKIVFNLLGIYNAETVGKFVKTCVVLHDGNGQVVITDQQTAARIAVASNRQLADDQKLRKALSQAFLATVSYVAGGAGSTGAKIKDFSVCQTYFRFQAKMSRDDMREQVLLGKALQLMTDASADQVLAAAREFGHVKVDVAANYDCSAAMKLFFADPDQRTGRSLADFERLGRQVLASLIDTNNSIGATRVRILHDNVAWKAMDDIGAVMSFGTIPELRTLSTNELADVGVDWTDIRWWAEAMSRVAPKLRDLLIWLDAFRGADPTTDRAFMKKRAALAGAIGHVARNSKASFAGGWGVAVMETVSGFAAPVTMELSADGKIGGHFESTKPALVAKPA
jgi:hypothetical protein